MEGSLFNKAKKDCSEHGWVGFFSHTGHMKGKTVWQK